MRAPRLLAVIRAAVFAGALVGPAVPAAAQRADSARAGVAAPRRRTPPPVDTVAGPPISARRAFLYSALVPGLGQAKLERYNAGALFVGVEMASVAMAMKSRADLRQAQRLYRDSIIVGYLAPDSTGFARPDYESCLTDDNVDRDRPCRITQERVRARRVHYEDWIAALIFNHLFAGADAFVAAQLWDLPTQVSARPEAGGGMAVSARVAW